MKEKSRATLLVEGDWMPMNKLKNCLRKAYKVISNKLMQIESEVDTNRSEEKKKILD